MTRQHISWCVGVTLILGTDVAYPQGISHSDVFFTYGEVQIQVQPQDERLVIPQIMPESGFFAQANGNPGFFSEHDIGGGTGPNDIVGYNVLGDLLFWSDGDFSVPKPDTGIRIVNNPGFVEETFIGTGTGEQIASFSPLSNSIGQSSADGNFHAHVDFRLEPIADEPNEKPLAGVYGLKLSLSSDNDAIEESDPFFVVFQFGIEEDQFIEALDDFNMLLLESPGFPGDFDADGILSATDIDLLSSETIAGTNTTFFDITGDQIVDALDRTKWVEELVGTFFGDANLDGSVEFSDFLALANGFGVSGGWAAGDFDGNGEVQFADFLSLANNFGKGKANSAAAVPEPSSTVTLAFFALATLIGLRSCTDARIEIDRHQVSQVKIQ